MRSDDAALEHGRGPRFLHTVVAGLAGVLAAAPFLEAFDGGLPPNPARAEAAAAVLASESGPARPPVPSLCFDGPGGEFLEFTPAGKRCP
jgi:hypothetical protein